MKSEEYMAKPDKTIKEHSEDLRIRLDTLWNYGYIKDEKLYELGKEACRIHDCGKANSEFQRRVRSDKRLRFNEDKEVAHNVLSLYFVDPKKYINKKDYQRVAFVVAFHHSYCDVFQTLEEKRELIEHLLEDFQEETVQVKTRLIRPIKDIFLEKESILLKGYLHKCDYCASANCPVELPNDFLKQSMEVLLETWKEKNAESHWNDMQEYCKEHAGENIMVVAQTGMGKTEGALHWIGNEKGFFVLPLRTAINAMYSRISHDIIGEQIEYRIALMHSESLAYLLKNTEVEMDLQEYYTKARRFSMPLTITTMDQLFDFVFRYNGYEMKLTTFSYSRIVIDEIQMYGPDLLAYLLYGIEMICEMGGKVAILTATLAPFIRELFEGMGFQYQKFLDEKNSCRHHIAIRQEKINIADIISKYKENKENKQPNKILVVCNSIRTAQQLYERIREEFSSIEEQDPVHILHSKFTRKDRRRLEQEILKTGQSETVKNEIWISTSVVEASLDIDFDYLFTELQDLNSLFQRMGRCNRKGKKSTATPNCYIYTEIEPGLIRHGEKGFIDKTIYHLSKEALLDGFREPSGIITEEQKIQLLEDYFTTEKIKESDFWVELRTIYQSLKNQRPYEIDKNEIDMRNIQSKDIIPKAVYLENKERYQEIYSKWKMEKNHMVRKELEEEMKEDILSIPRYEYRTAKKNEMIIEPKVLDWYGHGSIPVVDCIYDEAGFRRKAKESESHTAIFL